MTRIERIYTDFQRANGFSDIGFISLIRVIRVLFSGFLYSQEAHFTNRKTLLPCPDIKLNLPATVVFLGNGLQFQRTDFGYRRA